MKTNLDTIREALRQAYGSGYCEGYKQKHVEPDWIDEGFSYWIKNVNDEDIAALSTIEADAKPKEPSEDINELVRSIRDDRYLLSHGVSLITAHDDAIRRGCANRAVEWYNEPRDALYEHEDDDEYWNNSLRAAILATKPAREVTKQEYYWWCPECHQEVDGSRVTFEENHDTCGCRVIAKIVPAQEES